MSTVAAVPGVPEASVAGLTLPAGSPPAPWPLELEGLVWFHRAAPGAAAHVQPGLAFGRSLPLTVGSFVKYSGSPVGAYAEAWGSPVLVTRGAKVALNVPFMAVDSLVSVHGGRANWALPKSLADFTWERASGRPSSLSATGTGWGLTARVVSAGLRLPLVAAGQQLQVGADGGHRLVPARARGAGRLCRVEVAASGPSLPQWLVPGRHLGVVIERASLVVDVPSPA